MRALQIKTLKAFVLNQFELRKLNAIKPKKLPFGLDRFFSSAVLPAELLVLVSSEDYTQQNQLQPALPMLPIPTLGLY